MPRLDLTTHTSLSPIRRGFAPGFVNYKKGCTRLAAASDKVYQLLAQGRWFYSGTPAFTKFQKCFYYFTAYVGIMCLQVIVCFMESSMAYSSVTLFNNSIHILNGHKVENWFIWTFEEFELSLSQKCRESLTWYYSKNFISSNFQGPGGSMS
jgi:hypothetical protein